MRHNKTLLYGMNNAMKKNLGMPIKTQSTSTGKPVVIPPTDFEGPEWEQIWADMPTQLQLLMCKRKVTGKRIIKTYNWKK